MPVPILGAGVFITETVLFTDLYQNCVDRFASSDTSVDLATWMTEHTTLNKKPFSFKQYPFQEEIAKDEHPNLSCEKCSQVGLALALDTPLPTPTGWTTMGEVQVGDQVFDEQGKPCTVTFKSDIWNDRDCYEVEFDTGEIITCDGSHRWFVKTHRGAFNETDVYIGRGRPLKSLGYSHEGVVNTEFLAEHQGLAQFYVPNTQPLATPEVELPIDPWVLGLWLGDGHSYSARLTVHEDDRVDIVRGLERRGYTLRHVGGIENEIHRDGRSIYSALRGLGLIQNKHIPAAYLRGSFQQRVEVLKGLLDTDGSITKMGRVSFYNNATPLVDAVEELVASLGWKSRTRWRMNLPATMKNGQIITPRKPVADISFVTSCNTPLFELPRKFERQRFKDQRPRFTLNRTIVDVRKVTSVPTQCVTVDSPSHLYLCGKGMIPTHNTEVQIRKFFALLRRNSTLSGIFTLPNEKMYKRVYNGRMKPILDADDVFNPPMGIQPIRNMGMVQIMDSFGYITGCTEGDATSISADFLMHDELDLSPMDMIGLFQSRLQNSEMKMTQSFSTPSFLDYGINRQYSMSDQREYMIKCTCCNHWQIPQFNFEFLDIPGFDIEVEKITDISADYIADMSLDEIQVVCEKCRKPLDLNKGENREWVARNPSRTTARGYKVRPFSTGRIHPGYVFKSLGRYQQNDFLRGFYNTVLGEPFTESSAQIQEAEIKKVMAPSGAIPDIGKDKPVFLGLDLGQICHLTLHTLDDDDRPVFILFEQIPVFQLTTRLSELRKIYGIVQGCADRYPYTPTVDAIRDETAGTIMPVAYGGRGYISPHYDETKTIDYYNANRTAALDRVRSVIVNQQVVIAGYGAYRETIITHLRDMVRDEQPEKEPEWKKLNGNDHFFHSMALSLLARRVCEHVYTTETKSLLSNAIVSSVGLPTSVSDLGHVAGVGKITRLK